MVEIIVGLISVVLIKLAAIIVGYKITKLGHDTLVRGVKGEFDFGGKIKSTAELKLVSASPGLFFVLFGSFVIMWAIYVDKPIKFSYVPASQPPAISSVSPESMESDSGN